MDPGPTGPIEADAFWLSHNRLFSGVFQWILPLMARARAAYLEEGDLVPLEPDSDAYASASELARVLARPGAAAGRSLLVVVFRAHALRIARVVLWRMLTLVGFFANVLLVEQLVALVTDEQGRSPDAVHIISIPVLLCAMVFLQTLAKSNFYFRSIAVGAKVRARARASVWGVGRRTGWQ